MGLQTKLRAATNALTRGAWWPLFLFLFGLASGIGITHTIPDHHLTLVIVQFAAAMVALVSVVLQWIGLRRVEKLTNV